ncbi:MAG: HDIG domain-containing protein [Chloroflexota bacterium]
MTGDRVTHEWLAVVDDETAGSGISPEEAIAAAQRRFPNRTPSLTYRENSNNRPLPLNPLLEQLRPLLDNLPQPVYLVGGIVRDAVLQRASHDIDLVVAFGAVNLAFRIGNALHAPAYVLDKERDVGRVVLPDLQTTIDIAAFRGPTFESDIFGRDFTINALALPATARDASSMIDLVHGLEDIRSGTIRIVGPNSISDDPVRALRAVRQSLRFGFTLTVETEAAITGSAQDLMNVSPERIRDEIVKLIAGYHPDRAVLRMMNLDLLPVVLPEVAALVGVTQPPPHHEPVFEHTLSVLRWLTLVESPDQQPADPAAQSLAALLEPYVEQIQAHLDRPVEGGFDGHDLLRMGGLFHDIGKAETRTVDENGRIRFFGHDDAGATMAARRMKALAFSNEATDHVARIIAGHMRPLLLADSNDLPSRRAVYRFYRSTREAGIDIALLSLADHLATFDGPNDPQAWQHLLGVVNALLAAYFTAYDNTVKPQRLLTGGELMQELGLEPGPEVGRLLSEIEEAQAAGEISTREAALELARQLYATK